MKISSRRMTGLVFFLLTSLVLSAHAADYARTRFPIVLVHGKGGDKLFGTDYWQEVLRPLNLQGAQVYVAVLAAEADETVRGEQLLTQMRAVLAQTGAEKVNLIGHSQGGLSARYAAAVMPERVASVTTVATPHKGSELADIGLLAENVTRRLSSLFGAVGALIQRVNPALTQAQQIQSEHDALVQLSRSGMLDFNRRFPSAGLPASCSAATGASSDTRGGNVQRLFSWSGQSNWFPDLFDFTSIGLNLSGALMAGWGLVHGETGPGQNDGLVSLCSSRFGQQLGVHKADHADLIGQLNGKHGYMSADPAQLYVWHANRLKLLGL